MDASSQPLGVAIVAFNSADVIIGCLDSLFASQGAPLRVVVTDNASSDETVALIRDWAAQRTKTVRDFTYAERNYEDQAPAESALTLVCSLVNGGYAFGVNTGLRILLANPDIDLFWVLNPDCVVPSQTAAIYLEQGADGAFSLMSGRTVYAEAPGRIQTDGGRVSRWTGVCRSANAGALPEETPPPDPATLDFVTGGNLVTSRGFVERAGLMTEDYFLYYEEVDWAQKRGDLPLRFADGAVVRHYGGTAIGSGTASRRASPFANYFNYRNRIRFLARHNPIAVPFGIAHACLKAAQLMVQRAPREAEAALFGALGLPPPRAIRERIAPGPARRLAFGRDQ